MNDVLLKFIEWAKLKFKIHKANEINFYFKEREIWWCSLGVNIGHEQDGKNKNFERPVLILKKFNKHILWILPLTRVNKQNKYYFQIEQGGEGSFVVLSQMKLISSKRLTRKMRNVKDNEFTEIKKRIKKILG